MIARIFNIVTGQLAPLAITCAQCAGVGWRGWRWLKTVAAGEYSAATTLNEITRQSGVGMLLTEADIPVLPQVEAACELLGLDPLYVANEGKLIAICAPEVAELLLTAMRAHPLGQRAKRFGTVIQDANCFVQMATRFGGRRVVDWLSGEQLPRIC